MQKNKGIERVGTIGKNKYGSVMEVIEYNFFSDILVKFDNGYVVHTNWAAFEKGKVANPYDKTFYGVGYLGEGKYQTFKNESTMPQFQVWSGMISRCYGKSPERYKDVTVCDEWHNFQTFAKWYDENYYEIEGQKMELDKDIIIKGSRIYSPETCVFAPRNINCLFTKTNKMRGSLPIGVSYEKKTGKYRSRCNDGTKETIYLGLFSTPEEAFIKYKSYKESIIKQVAEKHKELIPEKLYNAMITYKVEITD